MPCPTDLLQALITRKAILVAHKNKTLPWYYFWKLAGCTVYSHS